jgi:hypothetical protein
MVGSIASLGGPVYIDRKRYGKQRRGLSRSSGFSMLSGVGRSVNCQYDVRSIWPNPAWEGGP